MKPMLPMRDRFPLSFVALIVVILIFAVVSVYQQQVMYDRCNQGDKAACITLDGMVHQDIDHHHYYGR